MAAFQKKNSSAPTTVSCLEHCRNVNYNYAASKLDAFGTFECYCGNDIQFTTEVGDSECGFPCPITVTDSCGRTNRIAVYKIQGESLPIVLPVLEPATEVSTSQVKPTTEVSISNVHPTTELSTSQVKPTTEVSTSTVEPTTEVSTSTVQPTTEVSTSTVEPTTFVATSTIEKLSTTSAVHDMTSIDDDKTTTVSLGSEKTSPTTTFEQSTEISTKVAELSVSTPAKSTSLKETIITHITKPSLSISTTAVETVSFSSNLKNPSISNQMQYMCPCASVGSKWTFLANMNMSIAELKIYLNDYLDELKQNLTIDKTKTSSYINTKISAPDDRKSSVSIGYFGIFLVGIPIAFIMCSDAMRFAMQIQKRKL
ncbi:Hypothetical predicted protein [Mytilus galloprovincialis]|uniref:WSC domain-containing protein n=1 Tax=Mytilus galloprovincialis TaxID=29158 RepID=A0A8B6DTE6_MYTGA|nr:Hypothetical predicted protein [Mytilus galloprovincialis]